MQQVTLKKLKIQIKNIKIRRKLHSESHWQHNVMSAIGKVNDLNINNDNNNNNNINNKNNINNSKKIKLKK